MKEATDGIFLRVLSRKVIKTFEATSLSLIFSNLIKKVFYSRLLVITLNLLSYGQNIG